MAFTPKDVIDAARVLIQDTRPESQRYTNTVLLGFVNQGLRRMATLRPDLFSVIADIPCDERTGVVQRAPRDSIRLIEIYSVRDGGALIETDRETMDQSCPSWGNDDAGPAVNFMRNVRNNNAFFIYPKAPAGQVLIGEYAQTPRVYGIVEDIQVLAEAYITELIDVTVFLAESIDNEHVSSGRASLFQRSFVESLTVSLQSRVVTDKESAGVVEPTEEK